MSILRLRNEAHARGYELVTREFLEDVGRQSLRLAEVTRERDDLQRALWQRSRLFRWFGWRA